jgi:hypothetical protein
MNEFEALAENLNKKNHIPKARRIRNNLESIEIILKEGTQISYLVKSLNEHGFEITLGSFKTELHKARKLAKEQPENKSVTENKVNTVIADKQTIYPQEKITEDKPKETNVSENEDSPIKKHLSMKEKAALRMSELGINTEDTNPLLKRLNQKSKDKK